MAEAEASATPEAAKEVKPKKPLDFSMLLALVNAVLILGVLGVAVYTKILFQRPAITETSERARLKTETEAPKPAETHALIDFETITANIRATPDDPEPAPGTAKQIQGQLHYAMIDLTIELRDGSKKDKIESIKPILLDKINGHLGKRSVTELNSVHGRYLLRTQIQDEANALLAENLVADVFFRNFMVQ